MKKHIVLLALFLAASMFLVPLSGQAASFKDVTSLTYEKEISYLSTKDIITGYPDGTFRPGNIVTRSNAVTMIGRTLGLDGTPRTTKFTDVPASDPSSGWIAAAVDKGIIKGYPDGTFNPYQPVTRSQMAIFLDRAFTLTKGSINTFSDVNSSTSGYISIMNLTASGITGGYPDGTFKPYVSLTRGQFSAFLARTLEPSFKVEPANTSAVKVINLTNAERSKQGLAPLQYDSELGKVAQLKSQDMKDKNYFDHTSPTYGSPFDMMKQFGIRYTAAGENIAMGQRTPEQVVNAWMNSTGHRQNILSTQYTHIGVGYVALGNYWTQMFIRK